MNIVLIAFHSDRYCASPNGFHQPSLPRHAVLSGVWFPLKNLYFPSVVGSPSYIPHPSVSLVPYHHTIFRASELKTTIPIILDCTCFSTVDVSVIVSALTAPHVSTVLCLLKGLILAVSRYELCFCYYKNNPKI